MFRTKFSYLFFSLLLLNGSQGSANEEGAFRFGLSAGNVLFSSDIQGTSKGAIGFGGFGSFFASDEMALNLGYFTSSHGDLKHHEINITMNYYFGGYDALFWHFLGGVSFVRNPYRDTTTVQPADVEGSAMGIIAGLGGEFRVSEQAGLSLVGYLNKVFPSETQLSNGNKVTLVKDTFNVMLNAFLNF
ncbi:MAG: hypothetical protein COT74_05180 [Bdellovibrionales bacterium CG10_big_fil_rev_8_21_14_0_10_45_34]|nr:MAG: hypothetical protein COT74_05180 [Bdellovibrionales bacterium CG10_big_fil_rev_8_21_14_0_10_45_34]